MIYEGFVRHRRFAVREQEFKYRVAYSYEEVSVDGSGAVRLLTLPGRWGVRFNPVRFYYCFDADERLESVVAEVTNTPWGEKHRYVLTGDGPVLSGEFVKRLHVSPFMSMNQRYVFRSSVPGETLSVHISVYEGDALMFDATLALRRAADGRRVTSPLRVLALIYGHALVLRLKGVRSYPHPSRGVA